MSCRCRWATPTARSRPRTKKGAGRERESVCVCLPCSNSPSSTCPFLFFRIPPWETGERVRLALALASALRMPDIMRNWLGYGLNGKQTRCPAMANTFEPAAAGSPAPPSAAASPSITAWVDGWEANTWPAINNKINARKPPQKPVGSQKKNGKKTCYNMSAKHE
jgi:hypothetical protein